MKKSSSPILPLSQGEAGALNWVEKRMLARVSVVHVFHFYFLCLHAFPPKEALGYEADMYFTFHLHN